MEEKLEEVVEETTQENQQDPGDENVVQVDESKFESAGDDDVIKVDLSNPPTPKEDKVETEVVAEEKSEQLIGAADDLTGGMASKGKEIYESFKNTAADRGDMLQDPPPSHPQDVQPVLRGRGPRSGELMLPPALRLSMAE